MNKTRRTTAYAKPRIFPDPPKSRRKRETLNLILRRFEASLASKPFDSITLSEIADGCGLARSTIYRLHANTTELLWAVTQAPLESMLSHALARDAESFSEQHEKLRAVPGAIEALLLPSTRNTIRSKLEIISRANLSKKLRAHSASIKSFLAASLILDWLEYSLPAVNSDLERDAANIVDAIFSSALASPANVQATVRQIEHALSYGFPPAVSLHESLASDEHILSMIDGKPYRELTRHVARFGFTPESYRRCFNLPDDYPMVARALSRLRRDLVGSSIRGAKQNLERSA